jgi:coenzyme F420 biosynthesis associated uncharacterized protein
VSGLIDWGLAARIAELAAGEGEAAPGGDGLDHIVAEATGAVRSYTGLQPQRPLPDPEWVSRSEWATINVTTLRTSIEPLERELGIRPPLPGPIGGAVGAPLGWAMGAQIGALVGFASRRVLGQYEFPLLGGEVRRPRLLFVAPNVEQARGELGSEADALLRWIALHEVTHAVHFSSAPWLSGHMRTLLTGLLGDSGLRIEPGELVALARRLPRDPRRLLSELADADPLTLLAAPSARGLIERLQATMAAIEGYAEHVMDAAAPAIAVEAAPLRSALERRREHRPPLARLLAWVLGIELKLRQYRDGKRFCDAVVAEDGIDALNRAWSGPAALPAAAEIAAPQLWLRRTAPLPI